MTEWKDISHTYIHFPQTREYPVEILCPNKTHYPPVTKTTIMNISSEMFPVLMHCQKWGFDKSQVYAHIYTGTCQACGDRYIYSPDATPTQLEMVKQELEKTR